MSLEIDEFSLCHNNVQMFDNPKHLYLTKESTTPGESGNCMFAAMMQPYGFTGDKDDYRDGFCAFNVLDFKTGMVFDIISNGYHIWIIYERLLIPGLVPEQDAFTKVIEIDRPVHPGEVLQCAVIYNQVDDTAEYFVNYEPVYKAESVPVKIESLQTGFGIITLHDIVEGKSDSCRGQGVSGLWGAFRSIRY